MIIKESTNTPICLAQIENMTEALEIFRTFRNDPVLQMSHMVSFLKTASNERNSFFEMFQQSTSIISNRYARQSLTVI